MADYSSVPDIGLLYDSIPLYSGRKDIAFYGEEAAKAGGPTLEVGCGSGRILLPIARAGGVIAGLDNAPGMLGRLRERVAAEPAEVRGRVTLHEGDARDFTLGARFALISAPFRVMSHMITVDDQLRLLASVSRHLAPGGRFVFDVFNPSFARMVGDRSAEVEDTPEQLLPDGRTLRRTARVLKTHWVDQLLDVELTYYVAAKQGAQPQRHVQAFPMRWYLRNELEHLLARAGFRVAAVYGGFDRSPLTDDSGELILVAERGS